MDSSLRIHYGAGDLNLAWWIIKLNSYPILYEYTRRWWDVNYSTHLEGGVYIYLVPNLEGEVELYLKPQFGNRSWYLSQTWSGRGSWHLFQIQFGRGSWYLSQPWFGRGRWYLSQTRLKRRIWDEPRIILMILGSITIIKLDTHGTWEGRLRYQIKKDRPRK